MEEKMKNAESTHVDRWKLARTCAGLLLSILAAFLVGSAPAAASAQSQVFVPANTSGDFGNPTDAAINPTGTAPIPAGALALRPGSDGQDAILRWTAPEDGHYAVKALYSGLDSAPTDTQVSVLLSAVQIFSSRVDGHGPTSNKEFSGTVPMLAGDTLEFVVAPEDNGNFAHDTTTLSVVITPLE
jgi:hypothetical protein